MTLSELAAIKTLHCGIDCNGVGYCLQFSRELREEYAAKYGCICGVDCRRCREYKSCRLYECAGEARHRDACKKA